ncbi:hypothetical protein ABW21_db0203151 [Orbilia brochopaga]|nr:hypothetical protein ABW21_db0203151 [Drechslerella brochopaga]
MGDIEEEEEEADTPEWRVLDYEADGELSRYLEEVEDESLTRKQDAVDSGEDELPDRSQDEGQLWEERAPRRYLQEQPEIVRPAVELVGAEQLRTNRIDRRYTQYVRCVHALLRDVEGRADIRIMSIVDRGWGLYSPLDFEEAAVNGRPLPPCPRNRQDIIDLAMEQGHPIETLPGTNGANPQNGTRF